MSLGFCHSPPRICQSKVSLEYFILITSTNPLDELCSANYVCASPPGILCGLPFSKDQDFVFGLGLWLPWEGYASFGNGRAPWHRSLYGELVRGIWGANFNGLGNDDLNKHGHHGSQTHSQDVYRIRKSHLL
jgi:hypothetical protein